MRYGWTWFGPEDDPDSNGTGWIEIGSLNEFDELDGDPLCTIVCRDFDKVRAEHPEWIDAKEADAKRIVGALNFEAEVMELTLKVVADQSVQEPGPEA